MRSDIGEVFVSCSDDKRTIFRLPKHNFNVFAQIETSTIRELHTLTYLALEEGGSRVAIGSQNGYLFIYDIKRERFEYAEKVHLGGVEGLVWAADKIITCSSDLAINIITVPKIEA
jgi:hypothetical protein